MKMFFKHFGIVPKSYKTVVNGRRDKNVYPRDMLFVLNIGTIVFREDPL